MRHSASMSQLHIYEIDKYIIHTKQLYPDWQTAADTTSQRSFAIM